MAEQPKDRWICLDVGETLIDETRVWTIWADILGITPFTFMAAMGAILARGGQFREVFGFLGRDDWEASRPRFAAAYGGFQEGDLYPDAKPAIDSLRSHGYRVAVVANQPAERNAELRFLGVRAEVMAMSEELGVHKPAAEFYLEALRLMGSPDPASVAYVGDRLDNDVFPAATAGMRPVWIRRGPWAAITSDTPPAGTLIVHSLTEMVERIGEVWA
ncbi:MAG TPA: HAD-IA family hydrolase [Candidatus Limnocylindrales bacterium]|nr:HAD-IA family hydrolase [Candidatus Limnocylindrales bacterium]